MSGLPAPALSTHARLRVPARESVPIAIFLALALFPVAAAFGAETYLLGQFMRIMIFAIAAIGLDLIVGYGALVSFGHAGLVRAPCNLDYPSQIR